MQIRFIPNFAPDGLTAPRQPRDGKDFFAAVAAAAAGKLSTPSMPEAGEPRRRATDHAHYLNHHEGYDDGLVHSHGWASSGR